MKLIFGIKICFLTVFSNKPINQTNQFGSIAFLKNIENQTDVDFIGPGILLTETDPNRIVTLLIVGLISFLRPPNKFILSV